MIPRSTRMARGARSSPGMDSRSGNKRHLRPASDASGAVRGTPTGCPCARRGATSWLTPDRTGWLRGCDRHLGRTLAAATPTSTPSGCASGVVDDGVPLCTAGHRYPRSHGCRGDRHWEDVAAGNSWCDSGPRAPRRVPDRQPPVANGLLGVAPNPSTGTTTVRYVLAEVGRVRMEVLDAAGRRVWELQAESAPAGAHTAVWDGRSSAGAQVGAGIYYLGSPPPRGSGRGRSCC